MNTDDDDNLDRRLEDAATPDQASVQRVVSAALRVAPVPRRAVGPLAVLGGLAAAFVVAVVALTWLAPAGAPDAIRMRNVGEVILVDYPDGSRAIIGPAQGNHELFAGFDYVMLQGERK